MRFSTFQRLKYLAIKFTGKFRLTDESFKSDLPTETLLKLHLEVDGLLPSSIETNALSYAYRPIHVFLDHPINIGKQQCKLLTLEEEIYAPFLAVNPDNKIRVNSCPILCDCSIKWLFDAPKDWWMRVEAGDSNIGLQCDDQRSLYFYSDYDFRSCPKSNLLKYFVPETASKLSPAGSDSSSASSPAISSPYSGSAVVDTKQLETDAKEESKLSSTELDTRESTLNRSADGLQSATGEASADTSAVASDVKSELGGKRDEIKQDAVSEKTAGVQPEVAEAKSGEVGQQSLEGTLRAEAKETRAVTRQL